MYTRNYTIKSHHVEARITATNWTVGVWWSPAKSPRKPGAFGIDLGPLEVLIRPFSSALIAELREMKAAGFTTLGEYRTARNRARRNGALPKGAGRVRCSSCNATAAADGLGSQIVLQHDHGCGAV